MKNCNKRLYMIYKLNNFEVRKTNEDMELLVAAAEVKFVMSTQSKLWDCVKCSCFRHDD